METLVKILAESLQAYDLKINFNPDTRLVSGTVDITYINNSPDVLRIWWYLNYTPTSIKVVPCAACLSKSVI